jgi:peptidase A4-like protein
MADGPAVPYNADGNSSCTAGQGSPGPGLYCYSLIGMIGNGTPFQLGSSSSFTATSSGRLYLGVNDNVFHDNHASWLANVVIPSASTSPYWSGYEVYGPNPQTQTFSTVRGSWRQPKALSCSTNENSLAFFWVGLGGAFINSKALEQIGTGIKCVNGTITYFAFYEVLPKQPRYIVISAFTPNPDDLLSAAVSSVGHNSYVLKITDITQNKPFQKQ